MRDAPGVQRLVLVISMTETRFLMAVDALDIEVFGKPSSTPRYLFEWQTLLPAKPTPPPLVQSSTMIAIEIGDADWRSKGDQDQADQKHAKEAPNHRQGPQPLKRSKAVHDPVFGGHA